MERAGRGLALGARAGDRRRRGSTAGSPRGCPSCLADAAQDADRRRASSRSMVRPAQGRAPAARPASASRSRSRRLPPEELAPEPIALTIVFEDEHVLVRRQASRHGRRIPVPDTRDGHAGRRRPRARARHRRRRRTAAARHRAPPRQGHLRAHRRSPRRPRPTNRSPPSSLARTVTARATSAWSMAASRASRASIDQPIGRDPRSRLRMAVMPAGRGQARGDALPGARAVRRVHAPASAGSRPGAPTRSGSTWPRSGIPLVGDERLRRPSGRQPLPASA